MRINNLEFRQKGGDRPAEIICWIDGTESCYTILWYLLDREGYHIEFVSSRPFELNYENEKVLWKLMRYGQKVLDAEFELKSRYYE
jgi:hypothetical protein